MSHSQRHSQYKKLQKKWVQKHRDAQQNLWDKHGEHLDKIAQAPRQLAAGSMAGMLMLAQPVPAALIAQQLPDALDALQNTQAPDETSRSPEEKRIQLVQELESVLPDTVQPLPEHMDEEITHILTEKYGIKTTPDYEGKRLNRTYGLIGQEQHLMRYPGDTMESHLATAEEKGAVFKYGMAPGRGAWGYFAQSREAMTEQDVEREKWYIAVPTFLSPHWQGDVNAHYQFYKYRKMIVVNPENGKAVIADVADAGPAQWTGKHLGGSPEVMQHLERVDGRARGPVLYYFIADPQDKIPLGPIEPGGMDLREDGPPGG